MPDAKERRPKAINGVRIHGVVVDEATALQLAVQPCRGDQAAIVAALTMKEPHDG
ncbi:hypothetical protein [Streptomyces sp. NPDC006267]|uniref:hypothetical protein n=1 Tax=Streptomyces sp. NPDC006267 TaxID=3157173 RepID=UPI0033AF9307